MLVPLSRARIGVRTGAFLLALAILSGMTLVGAAGGAFDGFGGVLSRAGTGVELEGPLSPAGDWFAAQRAGASGTVTARQYERALEQAAALRRQTERIAPELADAPWTLMGPTNIGGRVADVAVYPSPPIQQSGALVNPPVFAATAGGGVWKSADLGMTWTYSWDPMLTQATGAIAIGSDGTIYVGTGETNPGGGSVTWGGTGVYRSKDGGESWQHVGLSTSGNIGRIAVDPFDPDHVFVAAAGNLFIPGGERGLYRSTDGGDSWDLVLAGDNPTTGAADVAIDPEPDYDMVTGKPMASRTILASMWDHQRLPTHRRYAGTGSGVYRSADGGETWTKVALPGAPAPDKVGRIGVAFGDTLGTDPDDVVTDSNSPHAYAVIANNLAGGGVGVWRSANEGETWAKTSASAGSLSQNTFGWWFGRIFVDPLDDRHVFVPGVSLVESTNSGDSFGAVTGPHADQHAMAWDRSVDGRVYLGNDGGMYRSDAHGRNGSWIPAAVQGWTQHYSVDVGEQSPNRIVTGLQDNGCQRNYVAGNVATSTAYNTLAGCGDGLQTLINPADENIVYGCSQYGSCSRSTIGGGPAGGSSLGATVSDRRAWWVPLQFDPTNPSVMYYAGNKLNRSTNGGQTWTQMSEDLTTDPPQMDPSGGYQYGTITSVAAAKSDGNVIYVGTDDGLLWRTTDLGTTWTPLEDPDDPETPANENDLPGTWVTRVAVDPQNADVAYATFSGFRSGGQTPHVVRTTDGGRTWTNISGNLPAAPVNEIVVIPGGKLAVGTDVGVFLSLDGGSTWLAAGSDLPSVPVLDLRYHAGTNTLTAATFGLGIQRLALS